MGWKEIVKTVAPALGTALGGPLAGAAVGSLAKVLLGDEKAGEDAVAAAVIGANPDQLLAIKKADQDFALKMEEAGIKLEEVHAKDRQSAREREAKTGDNWTPRILAGVIVGGFLATVYMVLSGYVDGLKDPMIAGMVGTLIGYVSAKADQVVSYYFGSSAGSSEKTRLMAKK